MNAALLAEAKLLFALIKDHTARADAGSGFDPAAVGEVMAMKARVAELLPGADPFLAAVMLCAVAQRLMLLELSRPDTNIQVGARVRMYAGNDAHMGVVVEQWKGGSLQFVRVQPDGSSFGIVFDSADVEVIG